MDVGFQVCGTRKYPKCVGRERVRHDGQQKSGVPVSLGDRHTEELPHRRTTTPQNYHTAELPNEELHGQNFLVALPVVCRILNRTLHTSDLQNDKGEAGLGQDVSN